MTNIVGFIIALITSCEAGQCQLRYRQSIYTNISSYVSIHDSKLGTIIRQCGTEYSHPLHSFSKYSTLVCTLWHVHYCHGKVFSHDFNLYLFTLVSNLYVFLCGNFSCFGIFFNILVFRRPRISPALAMFIS
jgi:hypothetical protein